MYDNTFKVTASSQVDLAEILFKFAIEQHTIILEQQEQAESLESVFQQLTKK